jgi:two-component system nitrogen regulation response regulator GlnG
VAATNQDLGELVRQGRFRTDLYMRLNPATRLRVPALRERREDLPELLRFLLLEALRSDGVRPLVRQFLARFPTPEDFREEASTVLFARPSAKAARRDAFTVFLSREALGRLSAHGWPGNVRELRLFAANALVHALTAQLEAASGEHARAPAILTIADPLVDRLLGRERAPAVRPTRPAHARGRRVEIDLPTGPSFARISAEVERQYLQALFAACDGDLDRMARELLGPRGSARQVHLRLNQLGLRLRELRAK